MNRRGFLRFLLAAPIVGPVAVKAILSVEPYAFACAKPFLSNDVANRWARQLWLDMPREIYWSKFMSEEATRGAIITFKRVKVLSEPKDSGSV